MAVLLCMLALTAVILGVPGEPPRIATETWGKHVLAFYYGWYGSPQNQNPHWVGVDTANRQITNSAHYPLLGSYDSLDSSVIEQQLCWAAEADIGLIASWWGKGDPTDVQLALLLARAEAYGVPVTAYIEQVRSRTREEALEQVRYLLTRYGSHPAWLKVGGKPVIFVYMRAVWDIYPSNWQWVIKEVRRTHPAIFIGDRVSMEPSHISARAPLLNVFDGVHVYNVTDSTARKSRAQIAEWAPIAYKSWVSGMGNRVKMATVIPGFDDRKVLPARRGPRPVTERYDGATYRLLWEAAIQASPDWVLITSKNEFHEGSGIEPTVEHGDRELRATAEFVQRFKGRPARVARVCQQHSIIPAPPVSEPVKVDTEQ